MSKIAKVLVKSMSGLPVGHTIYLKDKSQIPYLVEKGYIEKEEKRGRKTKEEKSFKETK